MSNERLSVQDIEQLMANPSPEARETTVTKLAAEYTEQKLSPEERQLAEDIFRMLARDTEARVREALSESIQDTAGLPRDVALTLASDINTVALPIIRSSQILTDEDLIAIVAENNIDKAVAIADREGVSESVSAALVECDDETVATHLVANETAQISNASLHQAMDSFGESEKFKRVLGGRPRVPASVSERLVAMISDSLQSILLRDERLSEEVVTDLILQARERIVISFSAQSDDAQLWDMVISLHGHGSLTPSILIRAACMGDIRFFEAALAVRADVPIGNAIRLIHDGGQNGLEAIYSKAELPQALFTAVRAAVDVARDNEFDGGDRDRERLKRRTIERILTQCGDLGVRLADGDLDYLIGKMANLEASNAAASGLSNPVN